MLNPIDLWDEYLPSFELHKCEHSDGSDCLICLFELDHECDLDGIIMTTEGHA